MPNWIHRTTKQYLPSVASADLPESEANFIEEPDLSAVSGFASKYWLISGDTVTLMSQAERDAVDAAETVSRRDALADELDRTQTILRAFAEVVLDEFNNLRAQHGLQPRTLAQLKTAVRNKLDG